jgi:hypothetical protein
MNKTIRVIVHATPAQDGCFEFRLIFDDNCEKYYHMSDYEFRALRAHERAVIEQAAADYYEQLGEQVDTISLIFL